MRSRPSSRLSSKTNRRTTSTSNRANDSATLRLSNQARSAAPRRPTPNRAPSSNSKALTPYQRPKPTRRSAWTQCLTSKSAPAHSGTLYPRQSTKIFLTISSKQVSLPSPATPKIKSPNHPQKTPTTSAHQ